MKTKTHRSERGQALILIVFAILALIALTALAVDGGNVYAERRRAQNAADSTALDSALAMVRGSDITGMRAEGLARASSNRYTDADATAASSNEEVNVEIYSPPNDGPYNCANSPTTCDQYVQVIITAEIRTYFGRVIGIPTVTNQVQAVARGKPPVATPMGFGNAIVSLAPDECKAVTYQGNADTLLTGGGIYVNSNCEDTAFFNNSGSAALTAPCVQAVGGIQYKPGALNITPDPSCINSGVSVLPDIVYPDPVCTSDVSIDGDTMSPGTWPPAGHSGSTKFPPAGVENLESGIYCVEEGDFVVNGGDTLTGENVVIVVETGDISWNGGAEINLSAPTEGPYDGLLIFMPESNDGDVTINGNSNSNFTGSILVPSADVTINGTGSPTGLHCQIIGYTVDISGTSDMNLTYNADDNYEAPVPPQVELVQ
jgi:Flp pilus assembly protein TadG